MCWFIHHFSQINLLYFLSIAFWPALTTLIQAVTNQLFALAGNQIVFPVADFPRRRLWQSARLCRRGNCGYITGGVGSVVPLIVVEQVVFAISDCGLVVAKIKLQQNNVISMRSLQANPRISNNVFSFSPSSFTILSDLNLANKSSRYSHLPYSIIVLQVSSGSYRC